jgi:hypothetical protein
MRHGERASHPAGVARGYGATTRTGVDRGALVSSPSSPSELMPQHHADVSWSSAHVCDGPAVINVARDSPTTVTGSALSVVDPSPS